MAMMERKRPPKRKAAPKKGKSMVEPAEQTPGVPGEAIIDAGLENGEGPEVGADQVGIAPTETEPEAEALVNEDADQVQQALDHSADHVAFGESNRSDTALLSHQENITPDIATIEPPKGAILEGEEPGGEQVVDAGIDIADKESTGTLPARVARPRSLLELAAAVESKPQSEATDTSRIARSTATKAQSVATQSKPLPAGLVEGNKQGAIDDLAGADYADLTEVERDILRVARDSLKKKRFETTLSFEPFSPIVEKLVNDCIAKFRAQKGYEKEQIVDALKSLEEMHWIVSDERRTKEEILESELYKAILDLIKEFPGIHARDEKVQERLGITRNPFLKHLLVLERFQLVQKKQYGKLWNYFLATFEEDETVAELIVILYNDIVRQLVTLLIQNPGSSIMDLARNTIPPVFHGAIQYHLKKLEELGLISSEGETRNINISLLHRYNAAVSPALQFAIAP
jgi:predicted transcriptional regulator